LFLNLLQLDIGKRAAIVVDTGRRGGSDAGRRGGRKKIYNKYVINFS